MFEASIQAEWAGKCLAFSGKVGEDGQRVRARRLGDVFHAAPGPAFSVGCRLAGKMKVDRSQVTLFLPARKSVKHMAFIEYFSGSALCEGESQDPPHAPPPP